MVSSAPQPTQTGRDQGAVIPPDVYDLAVNALRFLAVDAINRANSGHPGTPVGHRLGDLPAVHPPSSS
jgi:Transketolase, thiamine diphosphate binding domain